MSARIPNAAWVRAAALAGAAALSVPGAVLGAGPQQLERGKYLFDAGGCANCHTDAKNKGPLLAGGRALKTPFGIFYGPNITPHPEFGIGRWSDADFIRAMREG
ncbi:MAG TPA: cytochrome C, partial [Alphaproteobacteria bacterium]